MTVKQISEIVTSIISLAIKIVVIVWLVNFIYAKTMEAYDFGYRVFTEAPVSPEPGREVNFSVTEGKSEKSIAESLEEKGLVRDANLAYLQIMVSEYHETLKPGMYVLNTSQTVEEMMAIMGAPEEVSTEEEEEE